MPDPTAIRAKQIADALGAVYNARVQLMAAAKLADEAHAPALHSKIMETVANVDECERQAARSRFRGMPWQALRFVLCRPSTSPPIRLALTPRPSAPTPSTPWRLPTM
jgi:hypothetical protein